MKKALFLLLAVTLALATQVWAGGCGDKMFGVKGGLSIASQYGSDAEDEGDTNSSRMVGTFGGFVGHPINPMWTVQGELLYAMKGVKAKWNVGDDEYNGTTKLTYLEVPVLLMLNIPVQGNIKPQIFAGPAIGFKLGAKHETKAHSSTVEVDIDGAKSMDFGLVVGAGVGFPMGPKTISLEGRYDLGLTNVYDKAEGDSKQPEVKNSVISFMVGIGF